MEAIVFIGHGNRSPVGRKAFENFINKTMDAVQAPIKEYCFYERAEPTLPEAIELCVKKGAINIRVIPVLLLPGVQTTEEMPAVLRTMNEQYPNVTIQFENPIGADRTLFNLIQGRLEARGFSKKGTDAVVLVGHGSHDPLAAKEFNSIAKQLGNEFQVKVQTGYLVTSPNYLEVTNALLEEGIEKVYIIPYFFFAGVFLEEMKTVTEDNGQIEICDELGYDEDFIQLLSTRANS